MKVLLVLLLLSSMVPSGQGSGHIRVLIIDGVNNHDWERTTEATKATLEQTGRFTVDVSTSPRKRAPREEWDAWQPRFSDYQVVLSNFTGAPALRLVAR